MVFKKIIDQSDVNNPFWKELSFAPNYEINNLAVLRNKKTGKILSPFVQKGYLSVNLCIGGKRKRIGIHQIVAITFHGPAPFKKAHAAHCDGNPFNNRPDNIKWKTPKQNADDRYIHGTHNRGENNVRHILKEDQVREIKLMLEKQNCSVIAKIYGVKYHVIHSIKARKSWTHVD